MANKKSKFYNQSVVGTFFILDNKQTSKYFMCFSLKQNNKKSVFLEICLGIDCLLTRLIFQYIVTEQGHVYLSSAPISLVKIRNYSFKVRNLLCLK